MTSQVYMLNFGLVLIQLHIQKKTKTIYNWQNVSANQSLYCPKSLSHFIGTKGWISKNLYHVHGTNVALKIMTQY